MAHLLALPRELCLRIFKNLEFGEKCHFSRTCKRYRTLLLPEILKTIRFTNNEASAESALAAVEAYEDYTARIEFSCHSSADAELTAPALPSAAYKVLKGHLTPNLHTVQLKFDSDFDDGEGWDNNEDGILVENQFMCSS